MVPIGIEPAVGWRSDTDRWAVVLPGKHLEGRRPSVAGSEDTWVMDSCVDHNDLGSVVKACPVGPVVLGCICYRIVSAPSLHKCTCS